MSWPSTAVATGELITAAQMNGLPVRIADTTLSASAASIDFTSIPSHYAHLSLVCFARSDVAATLSGMNILLNGDTTANYDIQWVMGNAAVVQAAEAFGTTFAEVGHIPGASASPNLFGAVTIEIPHYAQASNNKSLSSQSAYKGGTASGFMRALSESGFWRSSAAINWVQLFPGSGNFVSGSRVTLYGLP